MTAEYAQDIAAVGQISAVPIILRIMKNMTGMRFAAVARVTESQWITCAVDDSIAFGLKPGDELPLASTICNEIRDHRQPVIFGHASEHPLYRSHHTPKTYGLESYISLPLVLANGEFFGTLCAIDPQPADLSDVNTLDTLTLFAQLIASNLDLQLKLHSSQDALVDANESARLREQFMAVLGHDLRTPLSAIRMSADLLDVKITGKREKSLIAAIRASSKRMGALIEDVLDFARGRLGGGIPVKRLLVDDLQRVWHAVIDEVVASNPNVLLQKSLDIPAGIFCDPLRLSQLLSNLLSNAVIHGSRESPIEVHAYVEQGELVLMVLNQGKAIPTGLLSLLFQPFSRSEAGQRGEGLGLGLYIAAQIVEAHHGTLTVSSDAAQGTRFTARLPASLQWADLNPPKNGTAEV
jgi:signal transduction histidine kinase